MRPELVLMRVAHELSPYSIIGPWCPSPLHSGSRRFFTGIGHWDPNQEFQFGAIRVGGVINTYIIEFEDSGSYNILPVSAYQLHLVYKRDTTDAFNESTKAVDVQLGNFEYIPNRVDEIVFFQLNSTRILFAKLPTKSQKLNIDTNFNKVFCVGTHSSKIVCISIRTDGLIMLSAAYDGSIRGWRLSDGFMLFETNVSISVPKDYCIDHSNERMPKEKCPMCDEALENNFTYLQILLFISRSCVFAMGCLDGFVRLWKISHGNVQLNDDNQNLELIFEETLLPTSNAYITAFAIHSLGLSYGDVEQGAGEVSHMLTLYLNFLR